MTTTSRALLALASVLACVPDSQGPAPRIEAMSFANSEWSTPVNLGPTINSAGSELQPAVSPDGLSLYFNSNRTGGLGAGDIWVARRECADCPWGVPVNVTVLNSSAADGGPALSLDGHLMFFHTGRPGGRGMNDLYMSRRANPKDDFAWEPPTPLDDGVNTAALENKPAYLQSAEDGAYNLYFNRGPASAVLNDIYAVAVTRDGATRRPAVLVVELSLPETSEEGAHIRADGREILFQSNRAPSLGPSDLWTSARQSVHDPWSPPVRVAELSSEGHDRHAVLSDQGRTLHFSSSRAGGFGGDDLWMSTRTPSGKEAP